MFAPIISDEFENGSCLVKNYVTKSNHRRTYMLYLRGCDLNSCSLMQYHTSRKAQVRDYNSYRLFQIEIENWSFTCTEHNFYYLSGLERLPTFAQYLDLCILKK